jgi:surface antigen
VGGVSGAILGGKGNKAVAIGTGAALGGLLVGSSIGASLDRADRHHAERSWSAAMSASVGQRIV